MLSLFGRSRQCAKHGCVELHHKLLHRHENRQSQKVASNLSIMNLNGNSELNTSCAEQAISGMEGKEQTRQTTMTAQDNITADYIALRTVPVTVTNGNRSLHVNALLDDASTKTYINADVAAKLGLQGTTERVTVNVLNGHV